MFVQFFLGTLQPFLSDNA